ncbi:MAG: hypothetical protein ACR2PL_03945 [Dehalococcoidia bacterium]
MAGFEEFRAVAVEPVTDATGGSRHLAEGALGGIAFLEAGDTLAVTYTITVERV